MITRDLCLRERHEETGFTALVDRNRSLMSALITYLCARKHSRTLLHYTYVVERFLYFRFSEVLASWGTISWEKPSTNGVNNLQVGLSAISNYFT
jgi:hypothetical protein